jgi:AraC-like DNA-binding protein
MGSAQCLIRFATFKTIEGLRSPVADSSIALVQLGRRRVSGSLLKATLAGIGFSRGEFSGAMRANGILSQDNLTLGVLHNRDGTAHVSGRDTAPGALIAIPPDAEHDGIYDGNVTFAALSLGAAEFQKCIEHESGFSDLLRTSSLIRCESDVISETMERLWQISTLLKESGNGLSPQALAYWRQEIVEVFAAAMVRTAPEYLDHVPSSLKLVRDVEGLIESHCEAPIHISDACSALHVSRRSLHRAFHDVLGIGPIEFMRRKRLSAVHTVLSCADPAATRVTDVAINFGFSEMGRFSGYYLRLFGESPSETLRRSRASYL